MATLRRITTYPIKSLDPSDRAEARITGSGSLAGDREYAIVDAPGDEPHDPERASVGGDGDYVNGKRFAEIHRLRSTVDPEAQTVALRVEGEDESNSFSLESRAALDAWLSDYFGRPVSVRHEPSKGFSDRRNTLPGPSVVSTATLREVASWFPEIDVDSVRRRFRANLEVGDVPAFWEDQLYGDAGEVVAFSVGSVRLNGVSPCARCIVPARDPWTGAEHDEFRRTFVEKREETLPPWLDSDRFDHFFRLMVNTDVPADEVGNAIRVGDDVEVLGTRER